MDGWGPRLLMEKNGAFIRWNWLVTDAYLEWKFLLSEALIKGSEAHTLSQGTLKDNRNTASSSSRIRDDPEAVQARKKVYVICATENK
ncbi:hypothetical protein NC653_017511 [Populus alba x Populus x berolinensis]|uniref:Uncharacterized protein n=1 Tax=Populus alba x Populus x berolinensis TaxID=444605 RepID=A0AAD6QQT9_9ROSI|nr:hypothetical protein NC653_017511 [Populus alba x Populus x berolinensis]